MSDYTEKSVSMKCKKCGYEEEIPQWILEELNKFSDDVSYQMICPACEDTMFEEENELNDDSLFLSYPIFYQEFCLYIEVLFVFTL